MLPKTSLNKFPAFKGKEEEEIITLASKNLKSSTMKGTKRLGVFESNSDANDSSFRSKKVMAGSLFGLHSTPAVSQPQMSSKPQLDVQRAILSQQHVRALNKQFASWVQSQFHDHPDELWEDGVRDYLTHASNLMEKFSDVVKWIKSNNEKGDSSSIAESHGIPKPIPDSKSQDMKSEPTKSGFLQMSTTPGIFQPVKTGFFQMATSPSISQPEKTGFKSEDVKSEPPKSSLFQMTTTPSTLQPLKTGLFQMNTTPSILPPEKTGFFQMNATSCQLVSDKNEEIKPQQGQTGLFHTNNTPSIPKPVADTKNQEIQPQTGNTGLFQLNNTPSVATSWSFGASANSQAPFSFGLQASTPGTQTSAPLQNDASNEADEETEEQPSSPSVKKTEEKGVKVVHEVKCKLYVKSTDAADKDTWKDKGMGNLSIKCREGFDKGAKNSKPTIIVRNDVGRLLLNALIYAGIKTNLQKNSIVVILHTAVDDGGNDGGAAVARTFLIRTKTEEERDKLAKTIQEYAPLA